MSEKRSLSKTSGKKTKRSSAELRQPPSEAGEPVRHVPVLLDEILESLPEDVARFWDATLGLAGHASAVLSRKHNARMYGSDADEQSLQEARERLSALNLLDRAELRHAWFSELPFREQAPFDLILADLGISSLHLDVFPRGITFREEQPLDMRLNTSEGQPALEWLNEISQVKLAEILYRYGEEPRSRKIAPAILAKRPLSVNSQIVDAVQSVTHAGEFKSSLARVFQALRIRTNDELGHLERFLADAPFLLRPGGRMIVISFHSLEDRLVKRRFRELEQTPSTDIRRNYDPGEFFLPERKPAVAGSEEIRMNPRSRSAKMRVLERR